MFIFGLVENEYFEKFLKLSRWIFKAKGNDFRKARTTVSLCEPDLLQSEATNNYLILNKVGLRH